MAREIPMFQDFPEILAIGMQRIGQLGIEWMHSPVAREYRITKLWLAQDYARDGSSPYTLGYEIGVEDDPSLPAGDQTPRFPLSDFLTFLIDNAMPVEQHEELKARIARVQECDPE